MALKRTTSPSVVYSSKIELQCLIWNSLIGQFNTTNIHNWHQFEFDISIVYQYAVVLFINYIYFGKSSLAFNEPKNAVFVRRSLGLNLSWGVYLVYNHMYARVYICCSSLMQWKDAKPEDLMDSKLRCVFDMPAENEKTVSGWVFMFFLMLTLSSMQFMKWQRQQAWCPVLKLIS